MTCNDVFMHQSPSGWYISQNPLSHTSPSLSRIFVLLGKGSTAWYNPPFFIRPPFFLSSFTSWWRERRVCSAFIKSRMQISRMLCFMKKEEEGESWERVGFTERQVVAASDAEACNIIIIADVVMIMIPLSCVKWKNECLYFILQLTTGERLLESSPCQPVPGTGTSFLLSFSLQQAVNRHAAYDWPAIGCNAAKQLTQRNNNWREREKKNRTHQESQVHVNVSVWKWMRREGLGWSEGKKRRKEAP